MFALVTVKVETFSPLTWCSLTLVAVSIFHCTLKKEERSDATTCFAQKRNQLQRLAPCDDIQGDIVNE